MLNAQQVADKWSRNAAAAGPAIQAGVQAMQEADNPMVKAAAAESRWIAGCQRAATTHKFSYKVGQVSFQDWKNAMLQKGLQNYQNGIAGGKRKMLQFMQNWLPYIQNGKAQLPPRGTLQQNLQRMTQMVNYLADWRNIQIGGGGFVPMPGA